MTGEQMNSYDFQRNVASKETQTSLFWIWTYVANRMVSDNKGHINPTFS